MHDLIVYSKGSTFEGTIAGKVYKCAVGKNGLIHANDKVEGDGCTPVGAFPLRRLFYRPDLHTPDRIETKLPPVAIEDYHGWCDDPTHMDYNTLIDLRRFNACISHEKLWRDRVYNLVIEVGYNDDPIVPGKGSAIFIHLARENYSGTEGCIAFSEEDLINIIASLSPASRVKVEM